MKELKEINLGTNVITLKDNLVKSSILPKKTDELEQTLRIDGNVIIEGAVYTNVLEITAGEAVFKGAVFANSELHVQSDCKELIYFQKAVGSANSVASLLVSGRCIYGSDINSPSIKLKNCFVAGSIYGAEISLENVVVLGGVFASKKLSMDSSLVGTFSTPSIDCRGINYLLYPTAFSVEPMTYLPGTQFFSLSLADLGALYKKEEPKENTGKIEINIKSDTQRTVLTDAEGTQMLVNSYSVANRVLVSDMMDFSRLENHFIILSASLGQQSLKQYSLTLSSGEPGPDLNIVQIANFFFDIMMGRLEVSTIDDTVLFSELKEKYV